MAENGHCYPAPLPKTLPTKNLTFYLLQRMLLLAAFVCFTKPAKASAPPGGPCGNGLPGNDDDSRCASNQCRSGRCCDPSVGLSCLACSAADGFCLQNSCFACAPGEGCTLVGAGFGCCKAEFLPVCFRGCDLNGDCFPLAMPGEDCRGDADCSSNQCEGPSGNGVCCRADVSATCELCSETGECLSDTLLLAIIMFSSIGGCALITFAGFYWYLYEDTNYLRRLVLEEGQDSNVVVLNPEDPNQTTRNTVQARVFEPEFEESDDLVVEVTSEEERQREEWEVESEDEDEAEGHERNTLLRGRVISDETVGNVETAIEVGDGSRRSLQLDSQDRDETQIEESKNEETGQQDKKTLPAKYKGKKPEL